MTKHQLADLIRERTDLNKKDVLLVIDNFLDLVKHNTEKGDKVELRGFGTFYFGEKKEKKIFSPIAKKVIDIPARSTLMFKSSKMISKKII